MSVLLLVLLAALCGATSVPVGLDEYTRDHVRKPTTVCQAPYDHIDDWHCYHSDENVRFVALVFRINSNLQITDLIAEMKRIYDVGDQVHEYSIGKSVHGLCSFEKRHGFVILRYATTSANHRTGARFRACTAASRNSLHR